MYSPYIFFFLISLDKKNAPPSPTYQEWSVDEIEDLSDVEDLSEAENQDLDVSMIQLLQIKRKFDSYSPSKILASTKRVKELMSTSNFCSLHVCCNCQECKAIK